MGQLQLRVTQPREISIALDRDHFPTTIKPLMEGAKRPKEGCLRAEETGNTGTCLTWVLKFPMGG